jgi:hypothetical protein
MVVTLYSNEYDPLYTLCAKCGRYIKINNDCECELYDSTSRKNGDIIKKHGKEDISKK